MKSISNFLLDHADGDLLPWEVQVAAVERFGLPWRDVEEEALTMGLLPARYQRNRQSISLTRQLALLRSRVVVIGCGGLGGYVIEELARVGVGTIIAVDPDVFEEHNLNRQLLSTPAILGRPKVEAARARVAEINPAVTLVPVRTAYGPENGEDLLLGAQVVMDALDSIPTRLTLAETCAKLQVPLVHGTIGGWYGHVMTQFPGDCSIEKIYGNCTQEKGIETSLGNPSFTPAVVASLQVAEACKILLGEGRLLKGRRLTVDLLNMEFHEMAL